MVSGAGGSGIGGGVGGGDGGTVTGDGLCSVAYRSADAPVECDRKGGRGGREREEGGEKREGSATKILLMCLRTARVHYGT